MRETGFGEKRMFLYSYESMDEHVIDVYHHFILWRVTKLMIFDS